MRIVVCAIAIIILVSAGLITLVYAEPSFHRYVKEAPMEELMEKGRDYYRRHLRDSALVVFSVVNEKYSPKLSSVDLEKTILAQNNLGIIYAFDYNDYSQGYLNLSNAYDKAETYGMKSPQAIICLNIAHMLMQYDTCYPSDILQEKIDEYSLKGLQLAEETGNYNCMAAIVCNRLENNIHVDLTPYRRIMDENIPESSGTIAYARRLLRAVEFFQQKRYDEGRHLISSPIKVLSPELDPIWCETAKHNTIGKTYMEQGNFDKAEKSLMRALEISDSLNEPNLKLQSLSVLSKLPGRTELNYGRSYTSIRDSIMSNAHLRMAIELDFLHSIRREKEKSAALQETKEKLTQWLVIGGILIIFFSVFITIIIWQSVKLRERNRALYNQIQSQIKEPILPDKNVSHFVQALPESVSTSDSMQENGQSGDKYVNSSLNSDRSEEIYREISQILNDTDLICTPGFSLSQLASKVGVNTSYVSQVINERYGESFSTLINDLRIRVACRRLSDTAKYGMMTLEAISESVGFQSRSTFIRAFKKANGMTPSEYLKLAKSIGKEASNSLDEPENS
ncbi:MAG: helix-turn-helix domain-containing protein [Muribaculaceae bacterium]|nr:helix-turn-helix domain-containing protein [Muribaculaceae bacterium]